MKRERPEANLFPSWRSGCSTGVALLFLKQVKVLWCFLFCYLNQNASMVSLECRNKGKNKPQNVYHWNLFIELRSAFLWKFTSKTLYWYCKQIIQVRTTPRLKSDNWARNRLDRVRKGRRISSPISKQMSWLTFQCTGPLGTMWGPQTLLGPALESSVQSQSEFGPWGLCELLTDLKYWLL